MPLSSFFVRATVEPYLARHPDERKALSGLMPVLDDADNPCSLDTLSDHVTCSAVVIDRDRRVLHIGHGTTGRPRTPGGHVEGDRSFLAAALRGAREETGIPGEALCLTPQFLDTPIDIEVHDIDACPVEGESAHTYVDVRFAFYLVAEQPPQLALQEAEGCGVRWLPFADVRSSTLRTKLLSAQGLDGRGRSPSMPPL